MIDTHALHVALDGKPVLQDLNLTVPPARIIGLVGESGSGKSMTALAMMGLLPPRATLQGRIMLGDQDLTRLSDRQMNRIRGRRIGMIFQEPMSALNPLMSIGDQVAEALTTHSPLPRAAAMEQAAQCLARVGLSAPRFPLTLFPHELSGGQRQRVAIAIAIAPRPDLLIADEPTTALDVTTQAQILGLLHDLVRQDSMSLLLITHDLAVVAGIADQVAVIKAGRIVENAPTKTLFRQPRHPYTRQLLRAATHQPDPLPAGPQTTPLLQVQAVTREYRLHRNQNLRAVDQVSLHIDQGESLGLIGESGCGKSTLTRTILGLDRLQSGRILWQGQPLGRPRPDAGMQVVFQDPYASFDPRWTVERLIAEPFHQIGRPRDWRDRVAGALEDVGLNPDMMCRYIHSFSGGQRQRIAIARALITRPQLIILDEAVSALDMQVRAQVLDLLTKLRRDHGLAYLFISHDLSVVRQITNRVVIMDQGKIVEEGPTAQVMAAPAHPVTQRLIAATPTIPADWIEASDARP